MTLQVGPQTGQTRLMVFQLRHLDLQFALMALRALGKNIENQARAIHDLHFEFRFQIALLRGAEAVVKHHDFRAMLMHGQLDFLNFTATGKECGIRSFATAGDGADHLAAITLHQQMQFLHRRFKIAFTKINPYDNGSHIYSYLLF